MNIEKLQKMAGSVRTGGKGSVRRRVAVGVALEGGTRSWQQPPGACVPDCAVAGPAQLFRRRGAPVARVR